MYLNLRYVRDADSGAHTCSITLAGAIAEYSDRQCMKKLGYLKPSNNRRRFKHKFPTPTELADTLELLGVLVESILDSTGSYSIRVRLGSSWKVGGNMVIV